MDVGDKGFYTKVLESIDYLPINHSDKAVLRFVAARTVRFSKQSERIPQRHFLQGVVTSKGERKEVVCPPVMLSKSQLYNSIKYLKEIGILAAEKVSSTCVEYSLLVESLFNYREIFAKKYTEASVNSLGNSSATVHNVIDIAMAKN